VGAACATGLGEEVIKTVGSFLVVELMRQGLAPEAACRAAVARILGRYEPKGRPDGGGPSGGESSTGRPSDGRPSSGGPSSGGPSGGVPAELQVGYLAVDREGNVGAWAVRSGFSFALHDAGGSRTTEALSGF
jgi:N4-(beta-N-acetylglucosaminyl)-L-asparaginase